MESRLRQTNSPPVLLLTPLYRSTVSRQRGALRERGEQLRVDSRCKTDEFSPVLLLTPLYCSTVSRQRVLLPLPVLWERAGVRVISNVERPSTSSIPPSSASCRSLVPAATAFPVFVPWSRFHSHLPNLPKRAIAPHQRLLRLPDPAPKIARAEAQCRGGGQRHSLPAALRLRFTVHYPLSTIHYSPSARSITKSSREKSVTVERSRLEARDWRPPPSRLLVPCSAVSRPRVAPCGTFWHRRRRF